MEGVKHILRDPNLALIFCYGSKHIHVVSCSVRVKSYFMFQNVRQNEIIFYDNR